WQPGKSVRLPAVNSALEGGDFNRLADDAEQPVLPIHAAVPLRARQFLRLEIETGGVPLAHQRPVMDDAIFPGAEQGKGREPVPFLIVDERMRREEIPKIVVPPDGKWDCVIDVKSAMEIAVAADADFVGQFVVKAARGMDFPF